MAPMKRSLAILTLCLLPALSHCETTKDEVKSPKVRLKTDQGDIVLELNAEKAPISVENFLGYVKKKHYDGTIFHRVMENFMIQGGGFTITDGTMVQKPTGDGIKNEGQNGLKNGRGTIAMARTPILDSATSQFFINVVDNPMLDFPNNGGYAVFGKVVEGMDVVDKIRAMETKMDPSGREKSVPVKPVVVKSATVE